VAAAVGEGSSRSRGWPAVIREDLLRWIGAAFIDAEGTLRIGLWVLGSRGNNLYLRYRRPGGQSAITHVAFLAKKDRNWVVGSVETELIHIRR
jgi:hypothetical protein